MVERLVFLNPGEPRELRDRGLLRYRLNDLAGALIDLERYLAMLPNTADTDAVVNQLELIRRQLQGQENAG